jgi:transcriptional regulator with XRE-family HTH domain
MLTREEFLRKLGEALRAARERRGLSRDELAERLSRNPVDPEDYLRRLAGLCTLAQTIRMQKGLTHKQVAERAKLPVRFVRDLEACKIHEPNAYNIYCLSFGLGIPYSKFEARIGRLARTPLDDQDRPIPAKRKNRLPRSTPRRTSGR